MFARVLFLNENAAFPGVFCRLPSSSPQKTRACCGAGRRRARCSSPHPRIPDSSPPRCLLAALGPVPPRARSPRGTRADASSRTQRELEPKSRVHRGRAAKRSGRSNRRQLIFQFEVGDTRGSCRQSEARACRFPRFLDQRCRRLACPGLGFFRNFKQNSCPGRPGVPEAFREPRLFLCPRWVRQRGLPRSRGRAAAWSTLPPPRQPSGPPDSLSPTATITSANRTKTRLTSVPESALGSRLPLPNYSLAVHAAG